MATHLSFGRTLPVFLSVSLVLSLAVVFAPARAGHFLTHPAATPQVVAAARDARTLFEKGKEIKRDATVYITPRNIPKNDQFLKAYSADKAAKGSSAPGLLGIANQAYRAQDPNGQNDQTYTLADAMRDAIWRKNTAARLKSLTLSQSACADGVARKTPSIGLISSC